MSRLLDALKPRPTAPSEPKIPLEGQRVLLVHLQRTVDHAVLLAPAAKALFDGGAASVDVFAQEAPARALATIDLGWRIHKLPENLDLPPEVPKDRRSPWRAVREDADALAAKLAKRKFDVAIDLTGSAEIDSRRWLLGEHQLGWHVTPDIRAKADRHLSRAMVLPMRPLGITRPSFDIELALSEHSRARASGLYSSDPKVAILPGARDPDKAWAPEHFARIGRWVVERGGSVVVAGTPEDRALVREVKKQIGADCESYTNKGLAGLLAVLDEADAVVTNDTMPMQFAFLLRVPTLAIFTAMSPIVWGPWEQDPRFVVVTAQADADDIQARAALHYLEGLLACAR